MPFSFPGFDSGNASVFIDQTARDYCLDHGIAWRTGRELLDKLQVELPGEYLDGLLRKVQRRLKVWQSEQARALVFNASAGLVTDPWGQVPEPRCSGDWVPLRVASGSAARHPVEQGVVRQGNPLQGPLT